MSNSVWFLAFIKFQTYNSIYNMNIMKCKSIQKVITQNKGLENVKICTFAQIRGEDGKERKAAQ